MAEACGGCLLHVGQVRALAALRIVPVRDQVAGEIIYLQWGRRLCERL